MGPEAVMDGLRTAAAISRLEHVTAHRLTGPGAFALLDALTTSQLFVRENQMLHTLALDEYAGPFADLFVCAEADGWILLAEGPLATGLAEHIERVRRELAGDAEVRLENLLEDHQLFGIDGPYAWELTAALLGPEVLGVPYLSFVELRGITCFRAGKTGEYGFILMVPRSSAAAEWERLRSIGAPSGVVEANRETLDQCALENWHFFMRALDGCQSRLTPLELQLQWRVHYGKQFLGDEALRERRAGGAERRLTCFVSGGQVQAGDAVLADDVGIGEVRVAGWSTTRQSWVGWALLDIARAVPGLPRCRIQSSAGSRDVVTCSPPLLNNRSLFVDVHRHRLATRTDDEFPPLIAS